MGSRILPWSESALALRQRAAFAAQHDAGIPDLSTPTLLDPLDEWLAPLLHGKRRLDAVGAGSLHERAGGPARL